MGFHLIAGQDDMPKGFIRVNDRINLTRFDHVTALDFLSACQQRRVTGIGR